MEIIFDMCDRNKDGKVDRDEFATFMRRVGFLYLLVTRANVS